jgi:hypothetical protein
LSARALSGSNRKITNPIKLANKKINNQHKKVINSNKKYKRVITKKKKPAHFNKPLKLDDQE